VAVSPSSGPFKEDDVLTCTSDGYPQPSYSWTDADGVVVSTTSKVALPTGVFNLTCTTTGNFTTPCSASFTVSGFAVSGYASGRLQCSFTSVSNCPCSVNITAFDEPFKHGGVLTCISDVINGPVSLLVD